MYSILLIRVCPYVCVCVFLLACWCVCIRFHGVWHGVAKLGACVAVVDTAVVHNGCGWARAGVLRQLPGPVTVSATVAVLA
jgi:hypothetical protein